MNFPIQMYDPTREYNSKKEIFDATMNNIISKGAFINGPEVGQLEKKLQEFTEAKYAITCANGTDAIFITLLGLNIGDGDEVITVSHTWISTSETIAMSGATPVFVDINENDFNIDIDKIEAKITPKTRAILFVSLYGLMPDCEKLKNIADKHNIYLIEDGAQSFGAKFKDTRSCSCKYTDIATTSFFPSKPLGCWGDGGAVLTNNEEFAIKIRAIKSHGGLERFKHKYIGVNSRLDTIQAGVLLVKLAYFEKTLEERNRCAQYYNTKLTNITQLKKPIYSEDYYHAWAQYSLLCESKEIRDNLVNYLKTNRVNVAIFYPVGLHKQECFAYLGESDLPVTESVCDRIINLPCYADITEAEQDYIVNIIYQFFNLGTNSLVSVIMPVYNDMANIKFSVASIMAQSYTKWELIIVNDCSTDNSETILRLLTKTIPNIIVIKNNINKGCYSSINEGIQISSGKYVTILGSDDVFDKYKLEEQIAPLDKHESIVVVRCRLKRHQNCKTKFGESTLMFRKNIINRIGYFDSVRFAADTEFMERIFQVYGKNGVFNVPKILYLAKIRKDSLTTSKRTGILRGTLGNQCRTTYVKNFRIWHEDNKNNLYIAYPLKVRPFEAPIEML